MSGWIEQGVQPLSFKVDLKAQSESVPKTVFSSTEEE